MNVAGRIVRTNAAQGWMEVEIERPSCGSCSKANGCGLGSGSGLGSSTPIRLSLLANAEEGMPVSLQVRDKQLLHGVIFAYVLPLFIGLAGALVAEPVLGLFGSNFVDLVGSAAAPIGFVSGLSLGIVNLWRSGRSGAFGQIHPCMDTAAGNKS